MAGKKRSGRQVAAGGRRWQASGTVTLLPRHQRFTRKKPTALGLPRTLLTRIMVVQRPPRRGVDHEQITAVYPCTHASQLTRRNPTNAPDQSKNRVWRWSASVKRCGSENHEEHNTLVRNSAIVARHHIMSTNVVAKHVWRSSWFVSHERMPESPRKQEVDHCMHCEFHPTIKPIETAQRKVLASESPAAFTPALSAWRRAETRHE